MVDEKVEFYGGKITEKSIKFQMDFMLNHYVYHNDLNSLKILHFLADGILKGKNVEELYNKAISMFQEENG